MKSYTVKVGVVDSGSSYVFVILQPDRLTKVAIFLIIYLKIYINNYFRRECYAAETENNKRNSFRTRIYDC